MSSQREKGEFDKYGNEVLEAMARRIARQFAHRGEIAFRRRPGWRLENWARVVARAKEIIGGKG